MPQYVNEKTLESLAAFHGHRCPASLYGLRAGYLALELLNTERAKDHELLGIVETGNSHFANCFGDGVQYAAGTTFGKDNISKNPLGKFAFTLIQPSSKKAVRVLLRSEVLMGFMETNFFKMRKNKVPPNQLPQEDIDFVVNGVLEASDTELFSYKRMEGYPIQQKQSLFEAVICESCGEAVVTSYVVSYDGKDYCQPCANKMFIS